MMQYGCIGEKLTHSFSKEIHSRLFDYEYELCEVKKERLHDFMLERNFKAINVTIPYKQDVIPYLHFISDTAREIGAVNTIVNKDGKLYGYNTDFAGLCALITLSGIELKNKKVLILGSGGTSKTALSVAKSMKAKSVFRVSRTAKENSITYEQMYQEHVDAEVIINTTPCGMYPNICGAPVLLERFSALEGVVDVIYNPLSSNLVTRAKQMGIKAVGGLYMLVAQAVFAAELFLEKTVDLQEIERVYNEIVLQKRNIVLTGMPSSGKTTVGKILSEKLGREFIDTDLEVVKKTGKEIEQIFADCGEKGFREIESEVICEASKRQGVVIATGGGAILREENVLALKANGTVYFIDRPIELLVATQDRPLSSNKEDLQRRYNERYHIYRKTADKQILNNTTATDVAEVIKEDFAK